MMVLLATQTLIKAEPGDPPKSHPLRVDNGTGSGNYPYGSTVNISAPAKLDGFPFVCWMTIQGPHSIKNAISLQTTVKTDCKPSRIVAVYAHIKHWYPPGIEPPFVPPRNQKPFVELFRPKALQSDSFVRKELKIKLKVNLGDAAGALNPDRVFDILSTELSWYPPPQGVGVWHSRDLAFMTRKVGGESVNRNQKIRFGEKDIPYESAEGDSVRTISLWYEPTWSNEGIKAAGRTLPSVMNVETDLLRSFNKGNEPFAVYLANVDTTVNVVDTEPDAKMAGVIGDVIKSSKEGSTIKHFVTPKKSTELSQPYVILKAIGITAPQITNNNPNQIVEWDVGEEVPNEPLKRRVNRNTTGTGPTVVKIVAKQGGEVVAQMNVWVVWSDIQSTDIPMGEKLQGGYTIIDGGYDFKATIVPQSILQKTAEIPELTGANTQPPPGGNHLDGRPLSGGANKRWDISRQTRQKKTVPAGWANTNFLPPASLYQDILVYPTSNIEGNDDAGTGDEDNDPYSTPDKDVLVSHDTPVSGVANTAGVANDEVTLNIQFRELCRIQVGAQWYRISDFYPWRFKQKFKKILTSENAVGADLNGDGDIADTVPIWRNNGSVKEANNNDW